MKTAESKYKIELDELKTKINWYVENQALITQNDALISNQQAIIADLQSKVYFRIKNNYTNTSLQIEQTYNAQV